MFDDKMRQSISGARALSEDFPERLEEIPVYDVVSKWWRSAAQDVDSARRHIDFVATVTLAYLYKKNNLSNLTSLREAAGKYAIDELTLNAMTETIDIYGNKIISFSEEWSSDKLLAAALFSDDAFAKYNRGFNVSRAAPKEFCRLAAKVLSVNETDSVADVCSGAAVFMTLAALHTKCMKMLVIESDKDAVVIGRLRSMLLGNRFQVSESSIVSENISEIRAGKVFAHPPLYAPRDLYEDSLNRLMKHKGFEVVAGLRKPYRVGWLSLLLAMNIQDIGGRTVALAPDTLLQRALGEECLAHRQLAESGRVEAVIALPHLSQHSEKLFYNLLICSNNNKTIKMVDASDCFRIKRKTRIMTDEDIDAALRRIYEDTNYSRNVSLKDMATMGYDFRPSVYLNDDEVIDENSSVALENVLSCLGRGKLISAVDLNKLSAKTETGFQYLMIKDIEGDTVKMPLTYLSAIEAEWEKFCVREGDIIVSRSAPYKIAAVPKLSGKKVLASGNLYFLRVNEAKVNPIYLLGYLKSERGMRQLKRMAQGGSMLLQKGLMQIRIPNAPMELQIAFAKRYITLNAKIKELNRQAEAIEEELKNIMESISKAVQNKSVIRYENYGFER